ncbi:MAG: hypothetical protein K2X86_12935 [Cytophagaceae bacterium]|nr:hypothetical protein [Cytophagaceae bacterium]
MIRYVFLHFSLLISISTFSQKNSGFGTYTGYGAEEFSQPLKIYPGITSALSDSMNATAVKLSATETNLEGLKKLKKLTYIFLDNTIGPDNYYIDQKALENMFSYFKELEQLKFISIEDPRIVSYIKDLKNIKGLKFERFDEAQFNTALPSLLNLELLIIKDAKITSLPVSIGKLTSLIQLELQCINLINLPENIGDLKNLKVLKMQAGKMTSLPSGFSNLDQLKYLKITGLTAFKTFPEEIAALTELETLILELRLIVSISESIGSLTKMKTLELHESRKLYKIPDSLYLMKNLQELFISDCIELWKLEGLYKIDHPITITLNRCNYIKIAERLKLVRLKKLIIPASSLPSEIKKVKSILGEDKVELKEL